MTADAIRAYAAATDDPSPAAQEGRIATPVFAIVPVWEAIAPASRSIATDEARKRVVHFSQDMVLHRPIEAGMTLVSTATPTALLQRGSGTALVIHTQTRTVEGELVNEQWVTEFFRGIDTPESRGDQPADHRLPPEIAESTPLAEITQPVAADQPDRYAEASGDRFEIHLDDEAARAVGLPGRILHGFCTLALMSHAICEAAGSDPCEHLPPGGEVLCSRLPGRDGHRTDLGAGRRRVRVRGSRRRGPHGPQRRPRRAPRLGSERLSDLPLVAERIDDPAHAPAMLVVGLRSQRRAGANRLGDERVRVVDHEQRTAGRTADLERAEALHARVRRDDPEHRVTNRELRDDLVTFADEMLNDRAERRLVELDGRARTGDPQLGLDAAHPARLGSSSVLGGPHPSDGLSSSEIVT